MDIPRNLFDFVLMGLLVITLCTGSIISIVNFTRCEVLKGTLNGYIFFGANSIAINDRELKLESIEKLKFECDDYNGKHIFKSKGDLGPSLSNGTGNFVSIYFYDGQYERFQFEVVNYYDFIEIKPALVSYYRNGKIDFDSLANLLREKTSRDKKYLKAEVEN